MTDSELLAASAWLLMDYRNFILTDARLASIPVNIASMQAQAPSVGAFLHFWMGEGCIEAWHESNAVAQGVWTGSLGLVCSLKEDSSPASDENRCRVAWGDGTVTHECFNFNDYALLSADLRKSCLAYPADPRNPLSLSDLIPIFAKQ